MSKRSMFLGALVAGMGAAMFGCVSDREPEEVEQPAKQPPMHAVAPAQPGKTAHPGATAHQGAKPAQPGATAHQGAKPAHAARPAGPNQMIGGGGRSRVATAVPPPKEETGSKPPATTTTPETPLQSVQQVSPPAGSIQETDVPGGNMRHIHAPAVGEATPAAEGAHAGQADVATE